MGFNLQAFSAGGGSGGGSSPATRVALDPTSVGFFEIFDDFCNGVNSGEPYGVMGWDSISNGTGGGNVQTAPTSSEQNTFGIWRCTCGITPNSNYGGIIGNQSAILPGNSTILISARFRINTLDDGTDTYYWKIGLSNTYPTTQNGVYFIYDKSSSVNWQTVTTKASVATTNVSSTAVDTNWHVITIIITNATSAAFYLDGTLLFTHTTNIPTATGQSCGPTALMLKTGGTLNRSWDIDWFYMRYTLGATRGTL